MNEFEYYQKIKNWDFSQIKYTVENYTNWDMYDELNKHSSLSSKILDLGTGGGERVIKHFPDCSLILATDFSPEMINTANNNLDKSQRKNITFKIMDNLNMTTPNNYFDIVVARNTCIDAKQIYNTLNDNGVLILHGVDKLDCWNLKLKFNKGQAFNDIKPISQIDYENILNAGFKHVELIPIHTKEYYHTKNDLLALLYKTPILRNFSEETNNNDIDDYFIDNNTLDQYIKENTTNNGILLIRRYYGIIAYKK